MTKAHRYILPDLFYACTVEDGGLLPSNAAYDALPPKPWVREWPKKKAGKGWEMVEDHRERKLPYFLEEFTQEATEYWLPSEGDDWQSQPRTMKEAGPLPAGHSLTRPEKPLSVAQEEKRREIDGAYETALVAALTMPSAAPTPMTVAMETSALLAVDPDAVDSIRAALDARRVELRAQVDGVTITQDVDNATAVLAVAAIAVSYPI